jgi:glutamine synthetase
MEAPPSVISTYLGPQLTAYLKDFSEGNVYEYKPATSPINLGVDIMPIVHAPAEDRNRTSPFPYGGHRFEFRAVGSSQNVSLVNTVLNALTAKKFAEISEGVEAGKDAVAVAQEMLKKHFKVIYNGNGYDPAWPAEADKLGITHIDSGVEAIDKFVAEKNVKMFEDLKVFDAAECAARRTILLDLYVGTIEMEVGCMIDMINQHAIPSAKAAGIDAAGMSAGVVKLEAALKEMHAAADEYEAAKLARVLRLDTMIDVRKVVDDVEAICPADKWTLATYKELLFVDVGKFA